MSKQVKMTSNEFRLWLKGEEPTYVERVKPKPKQTESQFQSRCVEWFREYYPRYADLLWHIPNEQKANAYYGKKLNDMGRVSGAPDLILNIARKGFHGLHLELKSKDGRLRESQQKIGEKLLEQGYQYLVVRERGTDGLDEFREIIINYLTKNKL